MDNKVQSLTNTDHSRNGSDPTPHLCAKNPEPGGSHHWILPEVSGAYSDGVCKWCNKKRKFGNSAEAINDLISKEAPSKWKPKSITQNR